MSPKDGSFISAGFLKHLRRLMSISVGSLSDRFEVRELALTRIKMCKKLSLC
jgi:hypothetical protein